MAGQKASSKTGRGPVTKQQVKSMVRNALTTQLEQKRYTVTFGGLATSTAGTVTPISQGVIQGDTANSRDGNQMFLHQLIFRHNLLAGTFATTQRVLVVVDTMADSAAPIVTDVLATANYLDGLNIANAQEKRFHVLHDEYVMASTTGNNFSCTHAWKLRVNRKVTYNAATNITAANGRNALFVVFISDNALATYSGSFELLFTDA